MIDPDYIRPFALCNKPRRVPYASPLPNRKALPFSSFENRGQSPLGTGPMPRLPGKPVQNMPPSPHRQGRRGYVYPPVSDGLFWREWWLTSASAGFLLILLAAATKGVGLVLAPLVVPIVVGNGVCRIQRLARMSGSYALAFAVLVLAALGATGYLSIRATLGSEAHDALGLLVAALGLLTPFVVVGALAGRDISSPPADAAQ